MVVVLAAVVAAVVMVAAWWGHPCGWGRLQAAWVWVGGQGRLRDRLQGRLVVVVVVAVVVHPSLRRSMRP